MLGSDRHLYSTQPEMALSAQGKSLADLGYEEFMERLIDPIITFDNVKQQWWIGDKRQCFVYNGVGLSEVSFSPTALGRYNGQLVGCGQQVGEDVAVITTIPLTLGNRGFKTLMTVEADLSTERAAGQVLWRSGFSEAMKASQMKQLDKRGFFMPVVAGTELAVRMVMDDYRNTHLSRLVLRYKSTDRTSTRGIINAGAPTNAATNS